MCTLVRKECCHSPQRWGMARSSNVACFSWVWNHASRLTRTTVRCNECGKELSISNGSTGNVIRHIKLKHPNIELETSQRPSKSMLLHALDVYFYWVGEGVTDTPSGGVTETVSGVFITGFSLINFRWRIPIKHKFTLLRPSLLLLYRGAASYCCYRRKVYSIYCLIYHCINRVLVLF